MVSLRCNVSAAVAVCSHDGQYIISGSEDQCVYVWRTQHDFYKFSSARRDRSDYWESVKGQTLQFCLTLCQLCSVLRGNRATFLPDILVLWRPFAISATNLPSLEDTIRCRRNSLFGRVVRLSDRRPAHRALKLAAEVRTGSRPNTTWRRTRGRLCQS